MKNLTKEKVQGVIIVILLLIIVFGGSYFLSEMKTCKENDVYTSEKSLNSISYQDYKELKNKDAMSIIYIARPGCSYCQQQLPIINQIISEYDLNINYMNTDNMSEDEIDELIASYDVFDGGKNFGTPTILLVKGGKIIDSNIGYNDKDKIVALFTKYELIKK